MLLFPALVLLAVELGYSFAVAVGGAALFTFLPNVWVYGGTALSDVPGATLAITASALLLRGRRDPTALIAGAALLGVAGGVRPASVIIGAVPALLGAVAQLRARRAGAVAAAVVLGGAILAGSYLGAALASSSTREYLDALRKQNEWVRQVDSFQNPERPPLHDVLWTLLARPFSQWQQMTALLALSVVALLSAAIARRRAPWLTVWVFLPMAIFTWLLLDVMTSGRYAIAYLPMYALPAAEGVAVLTLRRGPLFAGAVAALVAAFAIWTWPAVRLQATSPSPPVAALHFVDAAFRPHGMYMLAEYPVRIFAFADQVPMLEVPSWIVSESVSTSGETFSWPHEQLWRIVRQRNFAASVVEADRLRYGRGWYGPEGSGADAVRWMGREGEIDIPASLKRARLRLQLHVPLASLPEPPTIEVTFNGVVVDRIQAANPEIDRSWIVLSRGAGANQLRLTTTATFSPSREHPDSPDRRELGVLMRAVFWVAEQ
jgi:MFS family permease